MNSTKSIIYKPSLVFTEIFMNDRIIFSLSEKIVSDNRKWLDDRAKVTVKCEMTDKGETHYSFIYFYYFFGHATQLVGC